VVAGVVGLAAGLVGAGGAFLLVPLLLIVVGVPIRVTIGTSLAITALAASAGFVGKLVTAQIPLAPTLAVVAGAIPGAPPCDAAPCVTICPTVALYRRPDGIVDFDGARCIGCTSCMQACPYDVLYIDPDTRTAAKCNYCAHRVEVGLEPACVIVCPEQAIIAGDLDDPESRIARLVGREQIQVRKAEQGTRPKVFYVGADAAALTPELQASGEGYLG